MAQRFLFRAPSSEALKSRVVRLNLGAAAVASSIRSGREWSALRTGLARSLTADTSVHLGGAVDTLWSAATHAHTALGSGSCGLRRPLEAGVVSDPNNKNYEMIRNRWLRK